jgi:hypothetical protein
VSESSSSQNKVILESAFDPTGVVVGARKGTVALQQMDAAAQGAGRDMKAAGAAAGGEMARGMERGAGATASLKEQMSGTGTAMKVSRGVMMAFGEDAPKSLFAMTKAASILAMTGVGPLGLAITALAVGGSLIASHFKQDVPSAFEITKDKATELAQELEKVNAKLNVMNRNGETASGLVDIVGGRKGLRGPATANPSDIAVQIDALRRQRDAARAEAEMHSGRGFGSTAADLGEMMTLGIMDGTAAKARDKATADTKAIKTLQEMARALHEVDGLQRQITNGAKAWADELEKAKTRAEKIEQAMRDQRVRWQGFEGQLVGKAASIDAMKDPRNAPDPGLVVAEKERVDNGKNWYALDKQISELEKQNLKTNAEKILGLKIEQGAIAQRSLFLDRWIDLLKEESDTKKGLAIATQAAANADARRAAIVAADEKRIQIGAIDATATGALRTNVLLEERKLKGMQDQYDAEVKRNKMTFEELGGLRDAIAAQKVMVGLAEDEAAARKRAADRVQAAANEDARRAASSAARSRGLDIGAIGAERYGVGIDPNIESARVANALAIAQENERLRVAEENLAVAERRGRSTDLELEALRDAVAAERQMVALTGREADARMNAAKTEEDRSRFASNVSIGRGAADSFLSALDEGVSKGKLNGLMDAFREGWTKAFLQAVTDAVMKKPLEDVLGGVTGSIYSLFHPTGGTTTTETPATTGVDTGAGVDAGATAGTGFAAKSAPAQERAPSFVADFSGQPDVIARRLSRDGARAIVVKAGEGNGRAARRAHA